MNESDYAYEIQGFYGQGCECVATENTIQEAREQLKCYNDNESEYAHRIKKVIKGRWLE